METILDTALCTALAGYIHSSLSPRQVLASLPASMDSSLLEPYYIELGQLIQVNRICQGGLLVDQIQVCNVLRPFLSRCNNLAGL